MEKLFELSVVTRKQITGEPYVTVKVKSESDELLGKAVVIVKQDDGYGGIYFRYLPSSIASTEESIASVEIQSKNQQMVQEILKQLKETILQKTRQDSTMDFMNRIVFSTFVSCCIDEENGRISIPKDFGVNVTNETIAKYIFEEWMGIEVRISKTIQEKIHDLAEEKRRQEDKELKELLELMKNIGEEDDYLKILRELYKQDEDDEDE